MPLVWYTWQAQGFLYVERIYLHLTCILNRFLSTSNHDNKDEYSKGYSWCIELGAVACCALVLQTVTMPGSPPPTFCCLDHLSLDLEGAPAEQVYLYRHLYDPCLRGHFQRTLYHCTSQTGLAHDYTGWIIVSLLEVSHWTLDWNKMQVGKLTSLTTIQHEALLADIFKADNVGAPLFFLCIDCLDHPYVL